MRKKKNNDEKWGEKRKIGNKKGKIQVRQRHNTWIFFIKSVVKLADIRSES